MQYKSTKLNHHAVKKNNMNNIKDKVNESPF